MSETFAARIARHFSALAGVVVSLIGALVLIAWLANLSAVQTCCLVWCP